MNSIETSVSQKVTVCLTAFACSCAAFGISALLFIPLIGTLLQFMNAPETISFGLVLVTLLGTPILGALAGLNIGVRLLQSSDKK